LKILAKSLILIYFSLSLSFADTILVGDDENDDCTVRIGWA